MRKKQDVEPRFPGFAAVGGSDGSFANPITLRLPDSTDATLDAGLGMIGAFESHLAIFPGAFDDEKYAAVGDPTLVPNFSRRIVDAETLAVHAVILLVVLADHAAIQN